MRKTKVDKSEVKVEESYEEDVEESEGRTERGERVREILKSGWSYLSWQYFRAEQQPGINRKHFNDS
ncbi:hypothetical protein Pmani_035756 [Petrolisthes manimaculis]|uniref:Uncharacterized protein n=1 Tax=Petrolisthes manimaculis TaxID=1843537 RepID=A0AAE1NMB1_9EUCA|nr:hypothetical protein Pmani_035756 [Petrolisthes manimaculis]